MGRSRKSTHSRSKLYALVCAVILASAVAASAQDGQARTCKTGIGGQVVCGDLVIGITLGQYEAGLQKRAEEIRAEEAAKQAQLGTLVELTERATQAEKENLGSRIAAVEAEKRALEAESKGVAGRLLHLQASYDGLVQKLAEANAALEAFAALISKDAFAQAQAMLGRGDLLGAERKFVEIADTVGKIRAQADAVEARAIFQAGELAEQRIDWRAASTHYARAARLQSGNWLYAQRAGRLANSMGDYPGAASFEQAALSLATAEFGPEAQETATALNNLALTYKSLTRYIEAEPLVRRAMEISERVLGRDHPTVAIRYNNLGLVLQDQGRYAEAEPLLRRAIEISERVLGGDHPTVAMRHNNLASLLQTQGRYAEAEPLYRRAIASGEKAFGKDHPDVAVWYNNLAALLQAQDRHAEADPLYRQAIEILQAKLGPEHPTTVTAKANYHRLQQLKNQKSGNAPR